MNRNEESANEFFKLDKSDRIATFQVMNLSLLRLPSWVDYLTSKYNNIDPTNLLEELQNCYGKLNFKEELHSKVHFDSPAYRHLYD